MDIAASEWSAGCESGWTVYLEESYIPRNSIIDDYHQNYRVNSTQNDDDGEEDLSMVSDASSGPPHFHQEDDEQSDSRSSRYNNNCYSTAFEKSSKKSDKRSKKSSKEHKKVSSKHQHLQYHLDDTASSPTIIHSKMYAASPSTMEFSQSMSGTHYQGNSSFSNHYDAFWQPCHRKDDADHSAQPGQLRRRWE